MNASCGVVGTGIVGATVARELLRRYPDASVTLLEKESAPAAHQTGHNTGTAAPPQQLRRTTPDPAKTGLKPVVTTQNS